MNRNRWTCLFLALLATGQSQAIIHCVSTATGLQSALDDAESNQATDDIRLVKDITITSPSLAGFAFNPSDNYATNITGGWDAGCQTRQHGKSTVLSGASTRRILSVVNQATSGLTGISFERLRFIDAFSNTLASAGLSVESTMGGSAHVLVREVAFTRNRNTGGGNGALSISTHGTIKLLGVLIADNSGGVGGGTLTCPTGEVYVTNSTIADNTSTNALNNGGLWIANASPTYLQNNIFWNNDTPSVRTAFNTPLYLDHNNLDLLQGGSVVEETATAYVDPMFRSGSDYRLSAGSPLIDAGTGTPTGGTATRSLDGLPRVSGTTLDLGAYEFEALFGNGFE